MFTGRDFFAGFLVILSPVLFLPQPGECITVEPAAFEQVKTDVPAEVMAGEPFEIGISFLDRYGNLMPEDWKPPFSLSLSVSQPASVLPPVLAPRNYVPGFRFRVTTEKMGEINLVLRDSNGRTLESLTLRVRPGRLAKILVDIQDKTEAGVPVPVSFRAVDIHGNVDPGFETDESAIGIESAGARISGPLVKTAEGIFEIPVLFPEPGKQSVTIRDRRRGLIGISGPVDVVPAPLVSFEVKAEGKSFHAGEPIEITLSALDRFGNLVTDYARRYKGVRFSSKSADFVPSLVPPASFNGGMATLMINTRKSGEHDLVVSEIQSDVKGRLTVDVVPGVAGIIRVKTPESGVVGEPLTITLVAEDEYGNRTNSFPEGTTVVLEASGRGVLKPETVPIASFQNGTARVQVLYEVAESFEIRALLRVKGAGGKEAGEVGREEVGKRAAERAREEAVRSRRESRLKAARVSGKQTASPPQTEKPPKVSSPSPPPEKETPSAVAPAAKGDQRKGLVSREPSRPGVLDSVVVQDSEKNGIVVFSTNGMTDYNVTTSAKISRKWIDFEFPNIAVDLPSHLKGGSKIIGEVYVEKPENGKGTRISVEILPVRIGYDVYQEGDSLVLKVTRR